MSLKLQQFSAEERMRTGTNEKDVESKQTHDNFAACCRQKKPRFPSSEEHFCDFKNQVQESLSTKFKELFKKFPSQAPKQILILGMPRGHLNTT